jgi:hypothetical protein
MLVYAGNFQFGLIWQGKKKGRHRRGWLAGVSGPRVIDKGSPIGLAEFNTRESRFRGSDPSFGNLDWLRIEPLISSLTIGRKNINSINLIKQKVFHQRMG